MGTHQNYKYILGIKEEVKIYAVIVPQDKETHIET